MHSVNVKTRLERASTTRYKAAVASKAFSIVALVLDCVLGFVSYPKMHTPAMHVSFIESVDKGKDWCVAPILIVN